MAFNLLINNTEYGAYEELLSVLKREYNLQKHIIVLVKDRYTLSVERDIMERLNLSCVLNIDVMTFARFASNVLGKKAKNCLTPEGAVALLSKAINTVKSELLFYRNVSIKDGFVRDMYSTLTAIRSSGITPEMLEASLSGLGLLLRKKTQDIILIYKRYLFELGEEYIDGTTRLEALQSSLADSELVGETDFYITRFDDFNAQQIRTISGLVTNAKSVTLAFCAFGRYSTDRIYPIFTLKKLENIAQNTDVYASQITSLTPFDKTRKQIEKYLFSYDCQKKIKTSSINLLSAANTTEEIRYVCAEIMREVYSGTRFKDIGIICNDYEAYSHIIEKFFEMYDIPYHIDDARGISNHPLIRLISDILSVVEYGYKRENVMALMRNPLFNIDFEGLETYENYALKYNVDYNRIFEPLHLGDENERVSSEKYRMIISEYLSVLRPLESVSVSANIVQCLKDAMNSYDIISAVKKLADKEESLGFYQNAAITRQVYDAVFGILNIIEEIYPSQKLDINEFKYIFTQSCAQKSVTLVPQSVDCVVIRSVKNANSAGLKRIFIIGAYDGCVPYEVNNETIISEKDAQNWQNKDITFRPTKTDSAKSEKLALLQLLLSPYGKLDISFALSGSVDTQYKPGLLMRQLQNIFDLSLNPIDISARFIGADLSALIATRKNAKYLLSEELFGLSSTNVLNDKKRDYIDLLYLLADKNIKCKNHSGTIDKLQYSGDGSELFFNKSNQLTTSASEMECYFDCPFMHFVRYGLGAKERDTAQVKAMDTGNIIHSILELYYSDDKHLEYVVEDKVRELFDFIMTADKYKALLDLPEYKLLSANLIREAVGIVKRLNDYEINSDFKPYKTEYSFARNNAIPFCMGKYTIYLKGKIDRIDRFLERIIVLDYKTGYVDKSLKSVYYGKKLQLYVYMSALMNEGVKPAGVFYVPIKDKFLKLGEGEKQVLFAGQVTNDLNLIKNIDNRLYETDSSNVMGLKLTKKGEINRQLNKDNYLSDTDFCAVSRYAVDLIYKALTEICDKYIAPKPIENVCEYCNFKALCGYNPDNMNIRAQKAAKVLLSSFNNEEI